MPQVPPPGLDWSRALVGLLIVSQSPIWRLLTLKFDTATEPFLNSTCDMEAIDRKRKLSDTRVEGWTG